MNSCFRPLCACLGALALAGCSSPPTFGGCTEEFRYGLNVTVVDSITGAPPSSATLIARDGAHVDSIGYQAPFPNDPHAAVLILAAAGERAGTYDVTVRASGYREWSRSDVRVTSDECHVRGVELTARLQK